MTATEMAHELLWDFAKRAQAEEEAAYQRYRAFITASERVLDAKYQQHRETRSVNVREHYDAS